MTLENIKELNDLVNEIEFCKKLINYIENDYKQLMFSNIGEVPESFESLLLDKANERIIELNDLIKNY